jgi:hypothetical protein
MDHAPATALRAPIWSHLKALLGLDLGGPGQGRTESDLCSWREFPTLLDRSDPEVEDLRSVNLPCRVDGRPTLGAEPVKPSRSTCSNLHVVLYLTREQREVTLPRGSHRAEG